MMGTRGQMVRLLIAVTRNCMEGCIRVAVQSMYLSMNSLKLDRFLNNLGRDRSVRSLFRIRTSLMIYRSSITSFLSLRFTRYTSISNFSKRILKCQRAIRTISKSKVASCFIPQYSQNQ